MDKTRSILIVDDDPTQVAILTAYFAALNHGEINFAHEGSTALEKLSVARDGTDLIVTDLNMPNMDGFEFLRHLRETGFSGKIVLFSGHEQTLIDNAASFARHYGLDVIGQLKKPLTKSNLDSVFLLTEPEIDQKSRRSTSVINSDEIGRGLEAGEFVPYFQPKVELLSGRIVGVEALARWHHCSGRTISPGEFIPLADRTGQIDEITMAMFDDIVAILEQGGNEWKNLKISINIPPSMLADVSLPDRIHARLAGTGIDHSSICFEITESGIMEFNPSTIEILSRLRLSGFDLAIDDFGTGAANISNLRMFPYSELKIDQSFVNNILTDAFSEETVRISLSLARQLNMRVVAEGIENREVFEHVKAKGIDQAQGYFISVPLPADELRHLLVDRHAWLRKLSAPLSRKDNAA